MKTSGDFGMQGELPSHPELLDWLAVDFMSNGWNIKRLVKQMVMSATYRQSAVISPDKLKADPENIYLSRAPRYRIKAELIRDLVLSSSGLLVKKIALKLTTMFPFRHNTFKNVVRHCFFNIYMSNSR